MTAPTFVGIDVGGTFTDFVVMQEGRLRIHKVPTTPDDQSRAIVAGLHELGIHQADIVHGMTVATNALLERRGARTALLTTAGFGDVLVIGRQNRPQIYALHQERPAPLVDDEWRLETAERLDHQGNVLVPLDVAALGKTVRHLASSAVESLAIVFLFSFRNPGHEKKAAAYIHRHLPDLYLSLSSDILPEYREFERTSTTVINAYVQPLVARYLQRLDAALPDTSVRIMQSNGGAIGLQQAAAQAARVVLSGPAGGVVGAFGLAQQASGRGDPNLITFDMGGTSTDVTLCAGAVPTTAESTITDLPLRLPVIDIHTVGAGGGSIAYVDAGGGLHVGPRSAGAAPGPACYGRGGTEPTVTDANLVLGRLDPAGFLGGSGAVGLDPAAAHAALTALGGQLGLSAESAALGVIRVANATMERALRRVSVERGHDPRQFTLIPFGGAGPLHACELAETLGILTILLPPMPGVLSAFGMLIADVINDAAQTILQDMTALQRDTSSLATVYAALAERIRAVLVREGILEPRMDAHLDMRYRGQSYELTVPLALPIDAISLFTAERAFHDAHARRYGYAMRDETVEVVTLRVRGLGPGAQPQLPRQAVVGADPSTAYTGDKSVWFEASGPCPAPRYDRARLRAGHRFDGPGIITQFDTTTVVSPGWSARVDDMGNVWLTHVEP